MPQRLIDVSLTELVPETKEWNEGRGISLRDWIGCAGRIEQAIAYGEYFWPDFVDFDGCIFFAGFNEESYKGFMANTNGDRRAVEMVMNHRHLLDFFTEKPMAPTPSQLVYLGRLLREMWTAKFRLDFPDRQIVVCFREEVINDLLDYEITFYQSHDDFFR